MTDKSGLISRIVDRDDGPDDWDAFDTLAGGDRNAYQDLLHALRDDALVRQSVAGHLAVADRVALPVPIARNRFGLSPILLAASGWIAALVIGLVWLGGVLSDGDGDANRNRNQDRRGTHVLPGRHDTFLSKVDSQPPVPGAQIPGAQMPGAQIPGARPSALQGIQEPSLGELPYLLVEARRIAGSGKVEVFYVRRSLERTVVSEAYRIAFDDGGQPVAVPTDLNAYIPGRIY